MLLDVLLRYSYIITAGSTSYLPYTKDIFETLLVCWRHNLHLPPQPHKKIGVPYLQMISTILHATDRNSSTLSTSPIHSPTLFQQFKASTKQATPATSPKNHVILRPRHPPTLPFPRSTRRSNPHPQGDERNNHRRRHHTSY